MRWPWLRTAVRVASLVFAAWSSACASARAAQREVLVMDIAPRLVSCQGEAKQLCMRVRLGRDTSWTLFYDRIDGFTHETGYRYRLEVERQVVERPPADASRFRYRLVRVVSKVADTSG